MKYNNMVAEYSLHEEERIAYVAAPAGETGVTLVGGSIDTGTPGKGGGNPNLPVTLASDGEGGQLVLMLPVQ